MVLFEQGTSVLSPVIPFSLVLFPAMMIAGNGQDGVYSTHSAMYIMTFGLIAAKVTNRLVVSKSCHAGIININEYI